MNSFDLNKFVRWSIPGWISILSMLIFTTLDIISSPPGSKIMMYPSLTSLLRTIGSEDTLANIFTIAIIGFPLGFLIYQFYFFIRWNSPFSKNGLFSPFIVGREIDLNRTLRKTPDSKIALYQSKWRLDWINNKAFSQDHGFRWQYIESLFTEICQKYDTKYTGFKLYDRYRYLLEIMHILGASLGGVYIGFFGYLIGKMRIEGLPLTLYIVAIAISLVILLLSLDWEDRIKHIQQGLDEKPENLRNVDAVISFGKTISINHPSIFYLVFLGMVIFFVSPAIIANQVFDFNLEYIGRILLLVPLMIAWPRWVATKEEKRGVALVLTISVVLSLIIRYFRDPYLSWIDWAFASPLFVFLVMNLVLLKNRQNARDDLISFQYYTLQRFLEEDDCRSLTHPTRTSRHPVQQKLVHRNL